jgi:hypothetical protein
MIAGRPADGRYANKIVCIGEKTFLRENLPRFLGPPAAPRGPGLTFLSNCGTLSANSLLQATNRK